MIADDERDEIEQSYIDRYDLGNDLAVGRRKRAIFLINSMRNLRRLAFPDRNRANQALNHMDRLLAESRVFHPADHVGYNELLDFLTVSMGTLKERVTEKFPD